MNTTKKWMTLGLLAFLCQGPTAPAEAAPVLTGSTDQVVTVQPGDCSGCSANELDVLQRGMDMMQREMHNQALDGDVCIAEASLARDLAVVTFDAYRAGAVSESRWRDGLRAKAEQSAQLTDLALTSFLTDYRNRLSILLGMEIEPGSAMAIYSDLFAAGQFSRIFDAMAEGRWNDDWWSVLQSQPAGFENEVTELLQLQFQARGLFDLNVLTSRPFLVWREAELSRMVQFPDDFLVGTVGSQLEQLHDDYDLALSAEPWTVMGWGCGASAAASFRAHANELSRIHSIQLSYNSRGRNKLEDSDEGEGQAEPIVVDGEEITVTARAPVGVTITITITSSRPTGNGGRGGGGGGNSGGNTSPPPEETEETEETEECTPGEPDCEPEEEPEEEEEEKPPWGFLGPLVNWLNPYISGVFDNVCRTVCPPDQYSGYELGGQLQGNFEIGAVGPVPQGNVGGSGQIGQLCKCVK